MQRFFRFIGISSAILFCLLMFNQAYVKAADVADAIIHPGGCIGIRSVANVNGTPPACCAFGYVYDGETGQLLADVTVTLQSQSQSITAITQSGGSIEEPHYSAKG